VRLLPVPGAGDGLVRAAPGLPHAGSFVVVVSEVLRMGAELTVAGVAACLRLPGRGDGDEVSVGSGERNRVPNLALAVDY
jgi:hypothetical protein